MVFLVQFRRLRRGVPEVVRTLSFATGSCAAALASARGLAGTRHWPADKCLACDGRRWPHAARLDSTRHCSAAARTVSQPCSAKADTLISRS